MQEPLDFAGDVLLAAADELELCWLIEKVSHLDWAAFREPDLDNALTAVAVGYRGASACRKYRKALQCPS